MVSEAPEPTFLEKLRAETAKPREVVTVDGSWNQGYGEAELICLLINNAEKIERLIEAIGLRHMDHGGYTCYHDGFEGCDCYEKAVAACGICQSVVALNEGGE